LDKGTRAQLIVIEGAQQMVSFDPPGLPIRLMKAAWAPSG